MMSRISFVTSLVLLSPSKSIPCHVSLVGDVEACVLMSFSLSQRLPSAILFSWGLTIVIFYFLVTVLHGAVSVSLAMCVQNTFLISALEKYTFSQVHVLFCSESCCVCWLMHQYSVLDWTPCLLYFLLSPLSSRVAAAFRCSLLLVLLLLELLLLHAYSCFWPLIAFVGNTVVAAESQKGNDGWK